MKRIMQILLLSFTLLLLSACSQNIERADRTITLVQDVVTSITNEINEIQILESNIQSDFEATLNSSEDLAVFSADDTPIQQNIAGRREYLTNLEEHIDTVGQLSEELTSQKDNRDMPTEQIDTIISLLDQLQADLNVYVSDYKANLEAESQTYKSIANPETTYQNFFQVFDTISVLNTNNQMNLENVLGYFEPLNANLINFKVYLANLQESN